MIREAIEAVLELQGDRSIQNKKIAKKKAVAKSKVHCTGNQTPHLVQSGNTFRYMCKQKDLEKSRKTKKARKHFLKTSDGKKSVKKAVKTKDFRSK